MPRYFKNEEIRDEELRVIDENGEMIGIISRSEALRKAETAELDLILISANAKPPVAKILDYGQFLYQKQKEEQKNKAKQKKNDLKVMKLSMSTSDHDKDRLIEKAKEFLEAGDKVKYEMRLKGRQKGKKQYAKEVMEELLRKTESYAKVEQPVTVLDNAVVFTLNAK